MLAACKLRAVPININHRYVERELEHLFTDAGLAGLVLHRQFGDRVAAVLPNVPTLRHLVVVEDGTPVEVPAGTASYEPSLAAASPVRDFTDRSGDDLYIAYTGGTTGMPKGVVWRHEDLFFAALGGGDPLMHVSAAWGAFNTFFGGGKVVLLGQGKFSGAEVWDTVAAEAVNVVTVVGDAMARPVLDALAVRPSRDGLEGMFVFASGSAWSRARASRGAWPGVATCRSAT